MAQEVLRRLNLLDPADRQIFIQADVPEQSALIKKKERGSLIVPLLVWPTVSLLLSLLATYSIKHPHEVFHEVFDRPKASQPIEISSIGQQLESPQAGNSAAR